MDNKAGWRLGKMLDNRYEILEILGIGGMAVVYKAFDHKLKRNVAIKVLRDDVAMDEESRRRFRTEYQAVAMLSHPYIRAVYDVVSSGDTEYIVMEYVDGLNLKQYLNTKGRLPWKEALHFAVQINRALAHAHSKGIVHMDIKPQNIMVLKNNTAKVADFGIAQFDGDESGDPDEAVGSIHYISPEQARCEATGARTDIFSLGVVMYEMLTGKLPYKGSTPGEVAMQHFSVMPDAPCQLNPNIPERLEAITLKAMQPDAGERYQSAEEMLAELDDLYKSVRSRKDKAGQYGQRKGKNAISYEDGPETEVAYVIQKDVPRVSSMGELSKQGYVKRRMREKRVSTLLGFGVVLLFALCLFVFVWNYWLRGIFREAERVSVPDFTGEYAETITNNAEFTELFDFTVVYAADDRNPVGTITAQDPVAGSSRMIVDEGIKVTLTVSSGIELVTVPDVINAYYTDAEVALQTLGLNVMVSQAASDVITENYVISVDPGVGAAVSAGSFVTITVSAGPNVTYIPVPNLEGARVEDAIQQLQQLGLICTDSEITYVTSTEAEKGIVLWQNFSSGTEVVQNTKINLTVGSGPTSSSGD